VLNELRRWMTEQRGLSKSSFGKAIGYIDKRWRGLTMFLTDARIPLDSNGAERALRGPVLGRKNHGGSQSRRGTEASAILYSLVRSAELAGVDPLAYLEAATRKALANPDAVLLPADFKAELGGDETAAATAAATA
jgi:transposase